MNEKVGSYQVAGILLPVVLSFWLLGAHFLRGGEWLVCLLLAIFPLLLFIRRRVVVRVVQVSLVLAACIWMRITYLMLTARLMMGDDWQRLVCIMGAVICFTLLSACTFLHSRVEHHYGLR